MTYSRQYLSTDKQHPFYEKCVDTESYLQDESYYKVNATFIMLTRNKEIDDVLHTLQSIESHFNQWFQYPYVFLNDEPFSEEFKNKIYSNTQSNVEFGLINEIDWNFPQDVRDSPMFQETLRHQDDRGIMYGDMESYHKMCRFYSGFFYKHPLVQKYKWYWRIEPDVDFYCDISYDPFLEMELSGKKYGFTVLIPELYWSVPNLFRYTISFLKENPWIKLGTLWKLFTFNRSLVKTPGNMNGTGGNFPMNEFVNIETDIESLAKEQAIIELYEEGKLSSDEMGLYHLINRAQNKVPIMEDKFNDQEYNLCHFWSNFEIAQLSVFDNAIYDSYFQYLESNDGFWQERWGDAPVHSLGLSLTLDLEDVHYFRDIGYRHSILSHCPMNSADDTDLPYVAKNTKYARKGQSAKYDKPTDKGIGCRCKCPPDAPCGDVEDHTDYCMDIWLELAHGIDLDSTFDGKYQPSIDVTPFIDFFKDEYTKGCK